MFSCPNSEWLGYWKWPLRRPRPADIVYLVKSSTTHITMGRISRLTAPLSSPRELIGTTRIPGNQIAYGSRTSRLSMHASAHKQQAYIHTLGLLESSEEEGAAHGDGDDRDGDGRHGLDAPPLQEIHGCPARDVRLGARSGGWLVCAVFGVGFSCWV